MSKKDDALKLALEALKQIDEAMPFPVAKLAQKVIREALAEQPAQQQEPVAVVKALPMGHNQSDMHYAECQHLPVGTLLYTSPPASKPWVGLTEEEVDECYYWKGRQWTTDELVRHVEAKLREKNA